MKTHLKRSGIALITLAVINFFFEVFTFYYLNRIETGWSFGIRNISGILVPNLMCIAGGVITLIDSEKYCYRDRFRHTGILFLLLIPVILLTTPGSVSQKINSLLNLTTIPVLLVFYTLTLAQKEEKQWQTVIKNAPSAIDLRLSASGEWFNSHQIGPRPVLSDEFAALIERYVESSGTKAPLVINLLCAESVSEMMQDTMRETLQMYYEEEENRIEHYIAVKYRRVLFTSALSIVLIVAWEVIDMFFEEIVYWEIIGNVAAFGLWQAGYLVYDQSDLFDELLKFRICRHAKLCFIQNR